MPNHFLIFGAIAISAALGGSALATVDADGIDRESYFRTHPCGRAMTYGADEAFAECTREIETGKGGPDDIAQNINWRGEAYVGIGDFDRALADYNEALKRCASRRGGCATVAIDTLTNRGNLYFYVKKDYDRALVDFNDAFQLEGGGARDYSGISDLYYAIGNVYYVKNVFDRALTNYNEAVRRQPEDWHPHDGRGDVSAGRKDFVTAIAEYSEAIRLHTVMVTAGMSGTFLTGRMGALVYTNRGLAYEATADNDHAKADYKAALAIPGVAKERTAPWNQEIDQRARDKARERLAAMGVPVDQPTIATTANFNIADFTAPILGLVGFAMMVAIWLMVVVPRSLAAKRIAEMQGLNSARAQAAVPSGLADDVEKSAIELEQSRGDRGNESEVQGNIFQPSMAKVEHQPLERLPAEIVHPAIKPERDTVDDTGMLAQSANDISQPSENRDAIMNPLEILKMRLARGEIEPKDFEERRRLILE
jgi:predicted negative regulator of RcsB-dependent stress response